LVEAAAGDDSGSARLARAELNRRRLADPSALGAILKALAGASPAALEAAGDWLFFPVEEEAFALGRDLALQTNAVLDLAEARPGDPPGAWCREGLAALLALRGGRPLQRLLVLARVQAWAREVASWLPPDLLLPGAEEPGPLLARLGLGQSAARRARALAQAGDWPALARLGRTELTVARAEAAKARGGKQAAGDLISLAARPEAVLAWPGGNLALLEEAAGLTAAEGLRAAEAAAAAARQSGRPVIIMGNASLGGPPLWAAPGPWEQGRDVLRPRGRPPAAVCARLSRLRSRRLAGPALLRALWDLRWAVAVAGRGWPELRGLLGQASPWLEPEQAAQVQDGALPLSQGEYPWLQARMRARAALANALAMETATRRSLALVWGLTRAAGDQRRARGGAAPLVLPWIDKFAASTGRAADHVYLAELTAWLASLTPAPLLVLVDESKHPASPSLARILESAGRRRPDLVFRGLGCFADEPEPQDLAAALGRAAAEAHLVALRALPGPGPGAGLGELLAGRGQGRPLTPAGRDGADWLLTGTALASLAALASQGQYRCREEPACWVLTQAGFMDLGTWFRARVRALAGREEPAPAGGGRFWRGYVRACGLD
jgi:hypothetical protein